VHDFVHLERIEKKILKKSGTAELVDVKLGELVGV